MTKMNFQWQSWVAENLRLGVPEDQIEKILISNSIDSSTARSTISRLRNSPPPSNSTATSTPNGTGDDLKYQKLAWMFATLQKCAAVSKTSTIVERRDKLSRDEFFEEYYARNRPVVITGQMEKWPAVKRWTLDFLKEKYGKVSVEIQGKRTNDPNYEMNSIAHKEMLPLGAFIDTIRDKTSNENYMTANNSSKNADLLRQLMKDVSFPREYCQPDWAGRAFFWLGPAGTVTPLHHDLTNNFMAQVLGSKLVKLISPLQLPLIYNHNNCFCQVDLDKPDFDKFPLFKGVNVLEVELHAQEMLFLPVGWWHYVRGLSTSITVSFTNFDAPNSYFEGYERLVSNL